MSREAIMLAYTILLGAGAAGCFVFIGVYSYKARWWRSEMGAHVVAFTGALGFLEAIYFVRLFVGDWEWRRELVLVALFLVVVITWWRVEMFRRLWRSRRAERNNTGVR